MPVLIGDKYNFLHSSVKSSKLWGRTNILLAIYLTAKIENLSKIFSICHRVIEKSVYMRQKMILDVLHIAN